MRSSLSSPFLQSFAGRGRSSGECTWACLRLPTRLTSTKARRKKARVRPLRRTRDGRNDREKDRRMGTKQVYSRTSNGCRQDPACCITEGPGTRRGGTEPGASLSHVKVGRPGSSDGSLPMNGGPCVSRVRSSPDDHPDHQQGRSDQDGGQRCVVTDKPNDYRHKDGQHR